ncbi:Dynamin-related protein 4C [Platanthera zijinensis]|uniref:Dynamin-related protein 4C n=1 Tax=Platanthera zijinensis TaxID=2320716 RepID=A0AAP0AYZ5_9ASPA
MGKQSESSAKKRKISKKESPCPIKNYSRKQPAVDALTTSYNEEVRPLLDAVHRLRQLKIMQEGIQLPTIVVVGDQSSYVCVRNGIGSESYEKARESEEKLFMTHHLLSRIDKSIAGIPVLAQKLMQIQAQSIAKCLPDIEKKINEKLNSNLSELEDMPQNLLSVADAMRASIQIISKARETLKKLLIRGEFEDYPNENKMHGTARLAEMLDDYKNDLPADFPTKGSFLVEEIAILEEARCISLPNFLPKTAFITLLQMKVKEISGIPHHFVLKAWNYVEYLVLRVLEKEAENYPSLQACTRSAAQNLVEKMRRKSRQAMKEILEMEMATNYTCSRDFTDTWVELMEGQGAFMDVIYDHSKPTKINIKKIGQVDVSHLRGKHEGSAEQAFDTKMRLISYWNCVVLRLVDAVALHICKAVKILVDDEFENEIINQVIGSKQNEIEKMLEESPTISEKKERLQKSIQLLKESKEVMGMIMNRISVNSSD